MARPWESGYKPPKPADVFREEAAIPEGALDALEVFFRGSVAEPKSRISIWYADGCWNAQSTDPYQGSVGGTAEIVLATIAKWMAK